MYISIGFLQADLDGGEKVPWLKIFQIFRYIFLSSLFSRHLKSIQMMSSWSSQFYKKIAQLEIVNFSHNRSGSFERQPHCKREIPLFQFFTFFFWCTCSVLENITVYESVSSQAISLIRWQSIYAWILVSPQNMFLLRKTLKDKFSISEGHLCFFFSEWNFLAWHILFLIKSSKDENIWHRRLWSYRPSLMKTFSSYSQNKITPKWILNQHFKTSWWLYFKAQKYKNYGY